jgi:hypothetical protein
VIAGGFTHSCWTELDEGVAGAVSGGGCGAGVCAAGGGVDEAGGDEDPPHATAITYAASARWKTVARLLDMRQS